MKTKEEIIQSMCLTYDHRYFLPAEEEADGDEFDSPLISAMLMSQKEKEFVYNQMKQLFENDIEPYMTFKEDNNNNGS